MPEDRTYDGYDLSSVLEGGEESPRKEIIYYHGLRVFAARKGNFKLYFYKNNPLGYPEKLEELDTLELYNLQYDPSEQFDIAENHPGIAEEIEEMVRNHKSTVEPAENQMEKTIKEQNL